MPIVTGPGFQSFSNLQITARFDLGAGITLVFPAGRLIIAIMSVDADFPDVSLQTIDEGAGWRAWRLADMAAIWAPVANHWSPFPALIITDGTTTRLINDGVNPVNNLQYIYMEI